jgi:hypothetical protein
VTRDTIFISHAVITKDNEFVLWLASRLQLLGYKVWCDLNNLKGGEADFWGKVIEPQIRDHAAKVIVIVSKAGILKQGVIDEYNFARGIAQEKDLHDYVIPIRIEDVPFTARISLNSYNVINCSENWQTGLSSLVEKFDQDGVPKGSHGELSDEFNDIIFNNYSGIIPKRELYYSSWLCPLNIPEKFYLFKYSNDHQTRAIIRDYYKDYPIQRHGNYLFSFHNKVNMTRKVIIEGLDLQTENVNPIETIEIKVADIQDNTNTEFPTKKDCEYLLKRLFNWSLSFNLTKRGLRVFELANKKSCYYFEKNFKPGDKVVINYYNRKKRKNLVGKFLDAYWHMGLSFNFRLDPIPAYELKTHILFSGDGKNIWNSSSRLHSARRKKGRTWYNEHWRDQLLAFLVYLSKPEEHESFSIPISDNLDIRLPFCTKTYNSEFGYWEPKEKERMDIINSKDEEFELNEEINEEINEAT